MISRLQPRPLPSSPELDPSKLITESDVEQKLTMPFLIGQQFLGIPSDWIRTKEYMRPTEIDKAAGKRYGYIPDYSIWQRGMPLVIVEAKAPDVALSVGLREARLYASEINKRYPPQINPIEFVVATNGVEFAISHADSEADALIFEVRNLRIGTNELAALQAAINRDRLDARAAELANKLSYRAFYRVSGFVGGQAALNEQLGVNEFAQALFPVISKYFGADSDQTPDEVLERAYVATDEVGHYEGVLSTYLKDRTKKIAGNTVKQLETTKTSSPLMGSELTKFASDPAHFSRVQLLIGAVGAGKSTFTQRFFKHLMPEDISERTLWSFINFNALPPGVNDLNRWIADRFIESLVEANDLDIYAEDVQEKIFNVELGRFERGPAQALKASNPGEYAVRRFDLLHGLAADPIEFARSISRHFTGERSQGIVAVFDNVDKRSRDEQLSLFQAAQWFKDLTKSLVMMNLRDSTFEAHKDEKPLDAFSNAINFYIRPPRFAQVVRKRLDLVLESIADDVSPVQHYQLESGIRITYPSSRLGEFLLGIYLAMFARRDRQITHILEGLVAKDIRHALGMFGDIIVSPHVPTSELTGAALSRGTTEVKEFVLLKSLMRGRYRYFNGRSGHIRNILSVPDGVERPSNFLYADILDFLVRNRKEKVDFSQEGYALVSTLINRMSQIGYDENDVLLAVRRLVEWGLIEPESLLFDEVRLSDAIRVHASGFVHLRFLLNRLEYLAGVSTDLQLSSRELAQKIGRLWGNQRNPDLSMGQKKMVVTELASYFKLEYERRCRRHPFYEELGLGGKTVVSAFVTALNHAERRGTSPAARLI